MLVKFCDSDGGTLIFEEEREDISNLIAIFKNGGELYHYVEQNEYFYGKFVDICFHKEPNSKGEMIEYLKLYYDKISPNE